MQEVYKTIHICIYAVLLWYDMCYIEKNNSKQYPDILNTILRYINNILFGL